MTTAAAPSRAAEIMLTAIRFRAMLAKPDLDIDGSFCSNDHSLISGPVEGRGTKTTGRRGVSSAAMNELMTALHRSQAEALTKASARAFRRFLQTIHLWVGLILAIPIILIGLSGSALLVQREILRLSIPAASATGQSQSIARIVASAQTAEPNLRANSVELPSSPGRPALVQFQISNRPPRALEVYVDPVSLKVLGSSEIIRRGPIRDVLVTIHEYLMFPGHIGLPLVGWMAVAMTFMGLSGLILWWPRQGRWLSAFLVRR